MAVGGPGSGTPAAQPPFGRMLIALVFLVLLYAFWAPITGNALPEIIADNPPTHVLRARMREKFIGAKDKDVWNELSGNGFRWCKNSDKTKGAYYIWVEESKRMERHYFYVYWTSDAKGVAVDVDALNGVQYHIPATKEEEDRGYNWLHRKAMMIASGSSLKGGCSGIRKPGSK